MTPRKITVSTIVIPGCEGEGCDQGREPHACDCGLLAPLQRQRHDIERGPDDGDNTLKSPYDWISLRGLFIAYCLLIAFGLFKACTA